MTELMRRVVARSMVLRLVRRTWPRMMGGSAALQGFRGYAGSLRDVGRLAWPRSVPVRCIVRGLKTGPADLGLLSVAGSLVHLVWSWDGSLLVMATDLAWLGLGIALWKTQSWRRLGGSRLWSWWVRLWT